VVQISGIQKIPCYVLRIVGCLTHPVIGVVRHVWPRRLLIKVTGWYERGEFSRIVGIRTLNYMHVMLFSKNLHLQPEFHYTRPIFFVTGRWDQTRSDKYGHSDQFRQSHM
jgi:hypothetical protein